MSTVINDIMLAVSFLISIPPLFFNYKKIFVPTGGLRNE